MSIREFNVEQVSKEIHKVLPELTHKGWTMAGQLACRKIAYELAWGSSPVSRIRVREILLEFGADKDTQLPLIIEALECVQALRREIQQDPVKGKIVETFLNSLQVQ